MDNYLFYSLEHPERFGPFVERWKQINRFNGKYSVSDYGRIKSTKGILKASRLLTKVIHLFQSKMPVSTIVQQRFLKLKHLLPDRDLKKLPEYLYQLL